MTVQWVLQPFGQRHPHQPASLSAYQLQLGQHQAIGFIHSDKDHKHLHLVINKVNNRTLKLYHDSYIGKKTQVVADEIAQEMNLVRAKVIKQSRRSDKRRAMEAGEIKSEAVEKKTVGAKQHIQAILDLAINLQPQTADAYFLTLEKMGCKIHRYINKETMELRGYGVEINGTKMDASAVGKKYTLSALGLAGVKKMLPDIAIAPERFYANSDKYILKPLEDKQKTIILEHYAKGLGVKKEMLHNAAIEMVELDGYYFIATKNDSNGFTMYNVFTKEYYGNNDITSIVKNKKYPVAIVEDVFAYFKFKQKKTNIPFNFIILNSLANKDKAVAKLKQLNTKEVLLLFPNDAIGNAIGKEIENEMFGKVLLIDKYSLSTNPDKYQMRQGRSQDFMEKKKESLRCKKDDNTLSNARSNSIDNLGSQMIR